MERESKLNTSSPSAAGGASNPYQVGLHAGDSLSSDNSPTHVVRSALLKHERAIRSYTMLVYCGGCFAVGCGGIAMVMILKGAEQDFDWVPALLSLAVGVYQFWSGRELRRFTKAGRIAILPTVAFWLCCFPIGTIGAVHLLILMFGQTGRELFTERYHRVMRETPEMTPKDSRLLRGLLLLTALVMGFGLILTLFAT